MHHILQKMRAKFILMLSKVFFAAIKCFYVFKLTIFRVQLILGMPAHQCMWFHCCQFASFAMMKHLWMFFDRWSSIDCVIDPYISNENMKKKKKPEWINFKYETMTFNFLSDYTIGSDSTLIIKFFFSLLTLLFYHCWIYT